MLYKNIIFILAFFPFALLAQKVMRPSENIFRNEFSVVSDNDNYTLQLRDGYYTNGLYLKLSHAIEINKSKWFNRASIKKVINEFELGQAIYNPIKFDRVYTVQQDRPFAGYLAFTFGQRIFYNNNSLFEWGASFGTIGPHSYAKEVQRWYHGVIGIYDVKGWPYQLSNEMSLNFKGTYCKSLLYKNPMEKRLNIDGFFKVQLGNMNTGASVGGTLKLGLVENYWNSSHWRAQISADNNIHPVYSHELYFFYEPAASLQVYNAYLQGGLFVKDKGPRTVDINSIVFSQQFGLRYAQNRFTTALVYINKTKEAKAQIRNENFCSIQIAYRFGKVSVVE